MCILNLGTFLIAVLCKTQPWNDQILGFPRAWTAASNCLYDEWKLHTLYDNTILHVCYFWPNAPYAYIVLHCYYSHLVEELIWRDTTKLLSHQVLHIIILGEFNSQFAKNSNCILFSLKREFFYMETVVVHCSPLIVPSMISIVKRLKSVYKPSGLSGRCLAPVSIAWSD